MKITNADGVEFTEPVTVPNATASGHALNKGQADSLYGGGGGGGGGVLNFGERYVAVAAGYQIDMTERYV